MRSEATRDETKREMEQEDMVGWALTLGREGQRVRRGVQLGRFPLVIGRSTRADLSLDDDRVSRFHAEIVWGEDGLRFRDLNSANSSYLNGERVSDAPLRHGDRLRIGPFSLGCFLQDVEADTHVLSRAELLAYPRAAE